MANMVNKSGPSKGLTERPKEFPVCKASIQLCPYEKETGSQEGRKGPHFLPIAQACTNCDPPGGMQHTS